MGMIIRVPNPLALTACFVASEMWVQSNCTLNSPISMDEI